MSEPHESDGSHTEDRMALREFLAAALYMAIVLLAALVAVPTDRVPEAHTVVPLLLGTGVGLILAHWLAFRLATHVTEGGVATAAAAREAGAQVAGGLAVAVVASVPFLVLDGDTAVDVAAWALASLPALTGLAIARLRGYSWARSVVVAAVVLVAAYAVVAIKTSVGH